MIQARPPKKKRSVAFGTLTGLVSGFVVTLAVSLVVLGAASPDSGLRLNIPGVRRDAVPAPTRADADPNAGLAADPGNRIPAPVASSGPATTSRPASASTAPARPTHSRPSDPAPPRDTGTGSVGAVPPSAGTSPSVTQSSAPSPDPVPSTPVSTSPPASPDPPPAPPDPPPALLPTSPPAPAAAPRSLA